MLNPILAFSATRRMRSFRTMLIVIAYMAAMLLLALVILGPFMTDRVYLSTLGRSPAAYLCLVAVQFALLILIAPAMTSGAIAGERERQTLDLLLVTNTGSFRILIGKVLESFAVLALLIVCGLPVMCLCLLTGGVSVAQILIGELFLLAVAFACVSIGVFCSALFRSTAVSAVMSYLLIILIGVVTALPFVFGYPQKITDVVYDRAQYAALTASGARAMIPKLMYLNPGFGLMALVQGQLHVFSEPASRLGWGRIYATWLMADRAGWIFIAVACAGAMILISLVLLGIASLMFPSVKQTILNYPRRGNAPEQTMKEVLKALRPVKRRLRRNRFLKGAAAGLAAGLGAAAATQAAAFFIPVQDRGLWAAAAAAAVAVLTALGNALRPVRNEEAAKAADACGLKERAITALEGGDEPIRRLQRKDACGALEKLDVKKIRPGSVRKALTAALCCAAALACLILIPSPKDSDAEARKVLTRTLREGREAIERAAEEDEKTLTEEKKSELRKITGDLSRELDGSRDAADALVALDRAEKRLEEFRQKTAGDAAEGSETGNGESSDRGSGAGENGETGDPGQAASGQQQAAAGTVPTAAQMKTLQAMAALKGAVSPASAGSMYAQAALGSQGGQRGSGTSGTGNGNKAGNGAGEGSTNEEQTGGGKSGSSGHAEGTRPARYKEEQYETIYDPEHIDKAKQDAATDQNRLSDEDSLQLETGPGRGSLSGDVPWGEALQDYADTEARAADRENLTIQERQWVDEYYRLLTEQK